MVLSTPAPEPVSTGVIAGIVVGVVMLVVLSSWLMMFCQLFCWLRLAKNRRAPYLREQKRDCNECYVNLCDDMNIGIINCCCPSIDTNVELFSPGPPVQVSTIGVPYSHHFENQMLLRVS